MLIEKTEYKDKKLLEFVPETKVERMFLNLVINVWSKFNGHKGRNEILMYQGDVSIKGEETCGWKVWFYDRGTGSDIEMNTND